MLVHPLRLHALNWHKHYPTIRSYRKFLAQFGLFSILRILASERGRRSQYPNCMPDFPARVEIKLNLKLALSSNRKSAGEKVEICLTQSASDADLIGEGVTAALSVPSTGERRDSE